MARRAKQGAQGGTAPLVFCIRRQSHNKIIHCYQYNLAHWLNKSIANKSRDIPNQRITRQPIPINRANSPVIPNPYTWQLRVGEISSAAKSSLPDSATKVIKRSFIVSLSQCIQSYARGVSSLGRAASATVSLTGREYSIPPLSLSCANCRGCIHASAINRTLALGHARNYYGISGWTCPSPAIDVSACGTSDAFCRSIVT